MNIKYKRIVSVIGVCMIAMAAIVGILTFALRGIESDSKIKTYCAATQVRIFENAKQFEVMYDPECL